jgi:adenine-specific DNA methylase
LDLQRVTTLAPEKHNSFYRYFHPYFTRLPGNVSKRYIEAYTQKGDIVLDPFCGSGVVGMEALLSGRSAICSDLSPLAVFISKELLNHKVDLNDLKDEYSKLITAVDQLIKKIWSYGNESIYTGRNPFFDTLENEYWYPTGKLTYRSNFESINSLFDRRQLLTYAILFDHISSIKNQNIQNTFLIILFGVMSRANLTYMVSSSREGSILHNGGSSIFSIYDYRKPKNLVVIPPWERFHRKFKDILKIKEATNSSFHNLSPLILSKSKVIKSDILKLDRSIPESSVDYIFTDPPYGAKIPYLELSSMWAAWMKWEVSQNDLKAEIIEGGELSKDENNYCGLMSKSVEMMGNLIKKNGTVSIVFQHGSLDVWAQIMESAIQAKLDFDYATIQPTNSASIIKKKFTGKVLSVPLILNFTKRNKYRKSNISNTQNLNWKSIERRLKNESKGQDGLTYEKLYNILTKEYLGSGFQFDASIVKRKLEQYLIEFNVNQLTFIESER